MTGVRPLGESHGAQQRAYYETWHHPNIEPRAETPYLRRHVEESLRVARLDAGASVHPRVLEIGCGAGRYTLLLAARGIPVEGLDVAPALLERMRSHLPAGAVLPLHCADLESPPPALEGVFDLVLGYFVLHHLGNLDACVQSVARMLAPGGRAVFVEPNPWNVLYYFQIALTPSMTWEGERGMLNMRPRRLFAAMRNAGLDEMAVERFGFFPPFAANTALGARLERRLENVGLWQQHLPTQIFSARRPMP